MPKKSVDIATRQQVYLERLKAGYVKDWQTVQASLRQRVRVVLAALDVESLSELNRKELQKVLIGLRSAQVEVTAPAMTAFLESMPELAEYAARLEVAGLSSLVPIAFPSSAINSAMLAFDPDSMRDRSSAYWKDIFSKGDATAIARDMKPIIIVKDGNLLTLQDGRHRLTEAEAAGAKEINVTFREYDPNDPGERILDVTKVVAIGEVPKGPRFNAPTAKLAYQAALDNPVQATGELLATMVGDWPYRDALRVSNLVQKGWAQGLTLQDMIRQAVGTKKNNFEDGFLDVSRQHAGTVINTATQHVANAARMEVWENNNDIVDRYQWVSTLDRRTTAQCKSLDGKVFEAGKGPMPPIHANCRSTTVAVLSPEFAFLEEGGTRASSGPTPGYVDANETYYTWLQRQPATFQDTALGKSRAKLFRDGGLTADRFAELNLGRNFEALTLAEMREIEPAAFAKAGL